jgi:hypothetical protein
VSGTSQYFGWCRCCVDRLESAELGVESVGFSASPWNGAKLLFAFLLFLDVLVSVSTPNRTRWRPARLFRYVLFVATSDSIRRLADSMLRTLKTLVVMIFFLFSTLFFFSVMGVAIFGDIAGYNAGTDTEAETFETLPHAMVLMYAMLSTEGYPVCYSLLCVPSSSHCVTLVDRSLI